jgi:hypothetical protein
VLFSVVANLNVSPVADNNNEKQQSIANTSRTFEIDYHIILKVRSIGTSLKN